MQQKLKQMALFSNSEINTGRQMAVDMAKFFFEGDKLYFCIGDVSGKGVPAALFMSMTRSLFRAYSTGEDVPDRIAENE